MFYLGWRIPSTGAEKLYLGRVVADGATPPSPTVISDSDAISGMTRTTKWGRPAYGIAAGKSSDTPSLDIVGVIYSDDANVAHCKFRAYRLDGNGSFVKTGSGSDPTIDDEIVSSGSSINDCRFVNLFWNNSTNKFMAVWVQGGLNSFGPTYYAEFTYKASDHSIQKTKQVVVTNDRSASANKIVCNMSSSYSEPIYNSSPGRISIISVEAEKQNVGTDCTSDTGALRVDFYKPGR